MTRGLCGFRQTKPFNAIFTLIHEQNSKTLQQIENCYRSNSLNKFCCRMSSLILQFHSKTALNPMIANQHRHNLCSSLGIKYIHSTCFMHYFRCTIDSIHFRWKSNDNHIFDEMELFPFWLHANWSNLSTASG